MICVCNVVIPVTNVSTATITCSTIMWPLFINTLISIIITSIENGFLVSRET